MNYQKYDKYICDLFITPKHKINNNIIKKISKYPNIHNYILNRYDDEIELRVIIWRIYYHIDARDNCAICGSLTPFNFNSKTYKKYCSMSCAAKSPERNKKYKETCLKKYGHINPLHNEEIRQNIKENWVLKYGVDNPMKSLIIKEKSKQTCLKKYGVEYSWQSLNNIQKSKQTKLQKYGDENFINLEKRNQTCLEKYGDECLFKSKYFKNKSKQTLIDHYGVNNILKVKSIAHKIANSEIRKKKEFITKHKNNSFNKSKQEEQTYELLKEKYNDVERQYKDDRYPFACDFYIPSLDLFIECNYHWTHGNKPYEETKKDNLILEKWKSKNTKFYNNAIQTWSIRDPNKRKVAKDNNLNWIEFFNFNEFNNWFMNNTN